MIHKCHYKEVYVES